MQNFNQKTSKGLNLIELLLVLGVVAILLVAAFVVYPQVRDRNQANSEISNATAVKASITNLYASKGGDYTDLDTGIANQARAFPISMNSGTFTEAQEITSAWGGEVSVLENAAAVTVGGRSFNAHRTFTITYNGVPEGVCLGLVSGAATNFVDVRVGAAAGGDSVFTGTGDTFNPADAAIACSGAGSAAVVELVSN